MRHRSVSASPVCAMAVALSCFAAGCDEPSAGRPDAQPSAAPATSARAQPAPPEPPRAPDIIVDRSHVDVGKNRVEPGHGLDDRVAVFFRGAPAIEGRTVDVVAMRSAGPADVAAVVSALRQSKATAVNVKTETRDGATQSLPLAFPPRLADCAPVAWIAKDASLHVWPAAGGTAKRVPRGLAGPDLTLGMEVIHKQETDCESPFIAVGADDTMTWGLVFDVAMGALHEPWTRANTAVLVTAAVPGRKIAAP